MAAASMLDMKYSKCGGDFLFPKTLRAGIAHLASDAPMNFTGEIQQQTGKTGEEAFLKDASQKECRARAHKLFLWRESMLTMRSAGTMPAGKCSGFCFRS